MAKSPNWTYIETSILTENYPKLGNSEALALLLPERSYKSIQVKASRLGLKNINSWNKLKTTEVYAAEILLLGIVPIEEYINDATKILHKCTSCDNSWSSKPNNILNGSGCPICNGGFGSRYASEGTFPEKAYIYLLKIVTKSEEFIKLGVTSNFTDKRIWQIKYEIGSELVTCTVLKKVEGTGKGISRLEGILLNREDLVRHTTKLVFKGRTELFSLSEQPLLLQAIEEAENSKFILV